MDFSRPYGLTKDPTFLNFGVFPWAKDIFKFSRFIQRPISILFDNFLSPTVIQGPTFIFCQLFQALRLFPALRLFWTLEYMVVCPSVQCKLNLPLKIAFFRVFRSILSLCQTAWMRLNFYDYLDFQKNQGGL